MIARKIDAERLATFGDAYLEGLQAALASHPAEYRTSMNAARVAGKMLDAMADGTYNHDGRGFRNACKTLGIKSTRQSIESFICNRRFE